METARKSLLPRHEACFDVCSIVQKMQAVFIQHKNLLAQFLRKKQHVQYLDINVKIKLQWKSSWSKRQNFLKLTPN